MIQIIQLYTQKKKEKISAARLCHSVNKLAEINIYIDIPSSRPYTRLGSTVGSCRSCPPGDGTGEPVLQTDPGRQKRRFTNRLCACEHEIIRNVSLLRSTCFQEGFKALVFAFFFFSNMMKKRLKGNQPQRPVNAIWVCLAKNIVVFSSKSYNTDKLSNRRPYEQNGFSLI